jgi:hypothetical protein
VSHFFATEACVAVTRLLGVLCQTSGSMRHAALATLGGVSHLFATEACVALLPACLVCSAKHPAV